MTRKLLNLNETKQKKTRILISHVNFFFCCNLMKLKFASLLLSLVFVIYWQSSKIIRRQKYWHAFNLLLVLTTPFFYDLYHLYTNVKDKRIISVPFTRLLTYKEEDEPKKSFQTKNLT